MKCDNCGRFTGVRAGAVFLTVRPPVQWEAPGELVLCAKCFDLNGEPK